MNETRTETTIRSSCFDDRWDELVAARVHLSRHRLDGSQTATFPEEDKAWSYAGMSEKHRWVPLSATDEDRQGEQVLGHMEGVPGDALAQELWGYDRLAVGGGLGLAGPATAAGPAA